jgi:hypothetical protein
MDIKQQCITDYLAQGVAAGNWQPSILLPCGICKIYFLLPTNLLPNVAIHYPFTTPSSKLIKDAYVSSPKNSTF